MSMARSTGEIRVAQQKLNGGGFNKIRETLDFGIRITTEYGKKCQNQQVRIPIGSIKFGVRSFEEASSSKRRDSNSR